MMVKFFCIFSKADFLIVRHYMNYLVKCGFAMEDIDYETGGRPCLLYKSKM